MSQLPLFGEVPQAQPIARLHPRPRQRSSHTSTNRAKQTPLTQAIVPIARNPHCPPATTAIARSIPPVTSATPSACPIPPVPAPVKELPQGWVDPASPSFNYLKNCRLCGAPIKHSGLDHSLCSGDCGWVVDLSWLARQQRLKRGCASVVRSKEPEPQAATHSDGGESKTLDLFAYGLDGDTSEVDGGAV